MEQVDTNEICLCTWIYHAFTGVKSRLMSSDYSSQMEYSPFPKRSISHIVWKLFQWNNSHVVQTVLNLKKKKKIKFFLQGHFQNRAFPILYWQFLCGASISCVVHSFQIDCFPCFTVFKWTVFHVVHSFQMNCFPCADTHAEAGATHDAILLQAVTLRGDARTGQSLLPAGVQLETKLIACGEKC